MQVSKEEETDSAFLFFCRAKRFKMMREEKFTGDPYFYVREYSVACSCAEHE